MMDFGVTTAHAPRIEVERDFTDVNKADKPWTTIDTYERRAAGHRKNSRSTANWGAITGGTAALATQLGTRGRGAVAFARDAKSIGTLNHKLNGGSKVKTAAAAVRSSAARNPRGALVGGLGGTAVGLYGASGYHAVRNKQDLASAERRRKSNHKRKVSKSGEKWKRDARQGSAKFGGGAAAMTGGAALSLGSPAMWDSARHLTTGAKRMRKLGAVGVGAAGVAGLAGGQKLMGDGFNQLDEARIKRKRVVGQRKAMSKAALTEDEKARRNEHYIQRNKSTLGALGAGAGGFLAATGPQFNPQMSRLQNAHRTSKGGRRLIGNKAMLKIRGGAGLKNPVPIIAGAGALGAVGLTSRSAYHGAKAEEIARNARRRKVNKASPDMADVHARGTLKPLKRSKKSGFERS